MKYLACVLLLCLSCSAQWLTQNSSQSIDAITQTMQWASAVPATSQVKWGLTANLGYATANTLTLSNSHAVTLGNLKDGTTYYWRPISKDSDQIQVVGNLNSFTTPKIVVTVAPASASLTSGAKQQFTATVTGVSNQGVTWTTNGGTITTTGLLTAPLVTQQTIVTVTATSKVGAKRSGTATVTVNPTTPPPPIAHSVTLNWQASTTPGVQYRALRSTVDGGYYGLIADNLSTLSFVDNNVSSGQTYYYVVRAFNVDGESGNSNQAVAVIPTT